MIKTLKKSKKQSQQKQKKKIKHHSSCRTLPIRNLFEIFDSNDLRWLLDTDTLPENYDTEYLIPVLDNIIFEDEKLSGNKYYTNFIRKSDLGAKEAIKLMLLRWSYEILLCNPDKKIEIQEILSGLKIKTSSLDGIDFEMKRLTQQMQVRAMKEAGKEKEKQNFGKSCVAISRNLPNVTTKEVRESTVEEFRGYQQLIKEDSANG